MKKLLLYIFLMGALVTGAHAAKKPNIVFVLVDDMGWTDVGSYGSQVYETPQIDRLAASGIRFADAHSAHPMCVVSRYALMSGRYNLRLNGGDSHGKVGLPASIFTLAEALKAGGYRTFFAGKWHLGDKGQLPQDQGFEVNIGGHKMGAPASYFYPYGEPGHIKKVPGLEQDGEPGQYLTDRLTTEALRFIRRHKDEPFFVYLSHYGVHTPLQGKPEYVESYESKLARMTFSGPAFLPVEQSQQKMHQDNPRYAAMVQSIDDNVGRIVEALDTLGLSENTIIVLTSDNGGDSCKVERQGRSTSNAPLKGGKCWLYEGGIRVPLIVAGAKVAKPGRVSGHLVNGPDFYPTLLELTGLPLRPADHLDGVSFAAVIRGESTVPRPPAFWHFDRRIRPTMMDPGTAIRDGDLKLIDWFKTGKYELYNLRDDIGESRDLSAKMPDKVRALLEQTRAWRKEVGARE